MIMITCVKKFNLLKEKKMMLGVEPNYLLCFRGLVSAEFRPQTPMGGVGGLSPQLYLLKMPCKIL